MVFLITPHNVTLTHLPEICFLVQLFSLVISYVCMYEGLVHTFSFQVCQFFIIHRIFTLFSDVHQVTNHSFFQSTDQLFFSTHFSRHALLRILFVYFWILVRNLSLPMYMILMRIYNYYYSDVIMSPITYLVTIYRCILVQFGHAKR